MLTTYLKLLCVPAIWGATFIAGRIVSANLPPATSGFIRFLFALLALLIALQVSQGIASLRSITKRQLLGTAALGATGIYAYNLLFFGALAFLPASRTSLIVSLNPVMTMLLAYVFLREKLSLWKCFGMLIALIGVFIVITRGDFTQLSASVGKGEVMMFCAVTFWGIYTLISRKLLGELSSIQTTTLAAAWGALFLGITALNDIGNMEIAVLSQSVWVSLAFLGVIGTAIAFVWYNEALQKLGSARTVIFNNLVPVFGVFFGWLLLGEPLSTSLVVGGAIAVTGVFIVNY
jgi:drug/metabolite transporter (DMT)-like permease